MEQRRIALPTGVELDVWSAGDPAHSPIIFLHGFPESHRTWRHQMAELARDHYVIAPDQRGFARSSKPAEISDYTPGKMVADLFALADALSLIRFTLAAHDWGGAIGWAAALKAPERIARLIICNAPHPLIFQRTLIDDLPQRQASQYILAFRDTIEARIAENGLEWFFEHSFMRHLQASNVSAQDRAAYLDEWSQPGAIHSMLNWYRATPMHVPGMDEVPPRPAFLDAPFPILKMPVLIVWGMNDPALLPCQLEGLGALLADPTIARIDCGHFTPWEAPEAVNAAMRSFLEARPV
ncbi:MAG: alpha/beta hydrolase [Pseudomonadota bacterium]